MGNLHVILATTLDGFVAGESGQLDWIIMGDERADYVIEALALADTLLMGRSTYEGFAAHWPQAATNPNASPAEKVIGSRFNEMRKIVISSSLAEATWQGTEILRDIDPDEIRRLKEESATGIRLDGSISLVQQLSRHRLIDEYRLMVHPVALGAGRPLFTERIDLELTRTEPWTNGVVVLSYRPA